jgi:hypothetical protein
VLDSIETKIVPNFIKKWTWNSDPLFVLANLSFRALYSEYEDLSNFFNAMTGVRAILIEHNPTHDFYNPTDLNCYCMLCLFLSLYITCEINQNNMLYNLDVFNQILDDWSLKKNIYDHISSLFSLEVQHPLLHYYKLINLLHCFLKIFTKEFHQKLMRGLDDNPPTQMVFVYHIRTAIYFLNNQNRMNETNIKIESSNKYIFDK